MNGAVAMELRGVSKHYPGRIRAVESLSLVVRTAELLVLTGPSGCGKTTTLRLLAGLENPSLGEVWIDGRLANQMSPRERGLAMVFQEPVLYPRLSVYENLLSGMRLSRSINARTRRVGQRLTGAEIAAKHGQLAHDTSRRFRIEHLFERRPETLSGGEQQRVALGRALISGKTRLLLDEPLSNVDFQLRVEIRRQLKAAGKELGTTMVYVTHDQSEALALGDRIAVIRQGRLQQIGQPDELFSSPGNQFVAEFLAPTPIRFWKGRINRLGDRCHFELSSPSISIELPGHAVERHVGQEVILGIRPNAVVFGAEGSGLSSRISARVTSIEPQGNQVFAYLDALVDQPNRQPETVALETVALVARFDRRLVPAIGANVQFAFDPSHLLWFSADSGSALTTE